jgi:hypothetical protein
MLLKIHKNSKNLVYTCSYQSISWRMFTVYSTINPQPKQNSQMYVKFRQFSLHSNASPDWNQKGKTEKEKLSHPSKCFLHDLQSQQTHLSAHAKIDFHLGKIIKIYCSFLTSIASKSIYRGNDFFVLKCKLNIMKCSLEISPSRRMD